MLCSAAFLLGWLLVTVQLLGVLISLLGQEKYLVCCQEMAVTDKLLKYYFVHEHSLNIFCLSVYFSLGNCSFHI